MEHARNNCLEGVNKTKRVESELVAILPYFFSVQRYVLFFVPMKRCAKCNDIEFGRRDYICIYYI